MSSFEPNTAWIRDIRDGSACTHAEGAVTVGDNPHYENSAIETN